MGHLARKVLLIFQDECVRQYQDVLALHGSRMRYQHVGSGACRADRPFPWAVRVGGRRIFYSALGSSSASDLVPISGMSIALDLVLGGIFRPGICPRCPKVPRGSGRFPCALPSASAGKAGGVSLQTLTMVRFCSGGRNYNPQWGLTSCHIPSRCS